MKIEVESQKLKVKSQDIETINYTQGSIVMSKGFYIPAKGSITGSLVYELGTGSYGLSHSYFRGSGTKGFRVAEYDIARIRIQNTEYRIQKLEMEVVVENLGMNTFTGTLKIETGFFGTETQIEVIGTKSFTFSASLPSSAGTYTIKSSILRLGEVLDEKKETLSLSPKFRLLNYEEEITLSAGQTKTLTLNIENYGQIEGDVDIGFRFLDILDKTDSLWIKPNKVGSVSFILIAPDDLCGTYNGYLKIGEEQKKVRVGLRGMEVLVSALLDKPFYLKDEIATITISVVGSNQATLTAKVKLGENVRRRVTIHRREHRER